MEFSRRKKITAASIVDLEANLIRKIHAEYSEIFGKNHGKFPCWEEGEWSVTVSHGHINKIVSKHKIYFHILQNKIIWTMKISIFVHFVFEKKSQVGKKSPFINE